MIVFQMDMRYSEYTHSVIALTGAAASEDFSFEQGQIEFQNTHFFTPDTAVRMTTPSV
jgi:hypothetical protein